MVKDGKQTKYDETRQWRLQALLFLFSPSLYTKPPRNKLECKEIFSMTTKTKEQKTDSTQEHALHLLTETERGNISSNFHLFNSCACHITNSSTHSSCIHCCFLFNPIHSARLKINMLLICQDLTDISRFLSRVHVITVSFQLNNACYRNSTLYNETSSTIRVSQLPENSARSL